MRIESVVLNASPLITLFRSGQAHILPQLFGRTVVPQAVWQSKVRKVIKVSKVSKVSCA